MYSRSLCIHIKTNSICKHIWAYGWHYIFIYEIIVELNNIINAVQFHKHTQTISTIA